MCSFADANKHEDTATPADLPQASDGHGQLDENEHMSISTLSYLKETKNKIIGNPKAKNKLLVDGDILKCIHLNSVSLWS